MKTLKLKKFVFVLTAVIAFAMIALAAVVGSIGTANSQPALAEEEAAKPKLVLSKSHSYLLSDNPFEEFIITVKIEGVANIPNGIAAIAVYLTPLKEGCLDFVEFIESTDSNVEMSQLLDQNDQSETTVHMEVLNSAAPLTEDFVIGAFKFKFKQHRAQTSISFKCENDICMVDLYHPKQIEVEDAEPITLNVISDASLPNTASIDVFSDAKHFLSETDDDVDFATDKTVTYTISEPISYGDARNLKLTVIRNSEKSFIVDIVDQSGGVFMLYETSVDKMENDVEELAVPLGVGEHKLIITLKAKNSEFKRQYYVNLTVAASTTLDKPVAASVTEKTYNGGKHDFTPTGLADLLSANKVKLYAISANGAETEVGIDAFQPTDAGNYKIAVRPQGTYYWGDGMTAADAIYTFNVKKATLTATAGEDGELPTFASDDYKGSLENVITYKYYSDAECTKEVDLKDVVPGSSYYLKAVLKEGAELNFEFDLDEVTKLFVDKGFAYTEKGLPVGAWVGIGIAIAVVVAAIIAIIVIVLLKKKKKKEAAEGVEPTEETVAAEANEVAEATVNKEETENTAESAVSEAAAQVEKDEKAAEEADKAAEKEAKKAKKEAEKAEKEAAKKAAKEAKEAEKAEKEAAKQAEKEAKEAAKKTAEAEKEAAATEEPAKAEEPAADQETAKKDE